MMTQTRVQQLADTLGIPATFKRNEGTCRIETTIRGNFFPRLPDAYNYLVGVKVGQATVSTSEPTSIHPQTNTHNIVINDQQLAHWVDSLQLLIESDHQETTFDGSALMYVSIQDTQRMLINMQNQPKDEKDRRLTNGLCL